MIVFLVTRTFLNLYSIEIEQPFTSMCFFLSCCESAAEIVAFCAVAVPEIYKRICRGK